MQQLLSLPSSLWDCASSIHVFAVKPSKQEIDAMEQKFVEDIWLLLGSAHYRLLSQDEWVTALEEDFTVRRADKSVYPC